MIRADPYGAREMTILIEKEEHWQALADQGLQTVVDPMVYRCGESFETARGVADPDETWKLLDANVHAIGMFFDALILEERLPVFNYGDTFDFELNFDSRTLSRINEEDKDGPVLFDVDVKYDPYDKVKIGGLGGTSEALPRTTSDRAGPGAGYLQRTDRVRVPMESEPSESRGRADVRCREEVGKVLSGGPDLRRICSTDERRARRAAEAVAPVPGSATGDEVWRRRTRGYSLQRAEGEDQHPV